MFEQSQQVQIVNKLGMHARAAAKFVKLADAFGAKGYRVNSAEDFIPVMQEALLDGTVSIVDCPVDYAENMKLTGKLKSLKSPI